MSLHRLTHLTMAVPDLTAARGFYRDFGLEEREPGRFASLDGGEQLRLIEAPRRGLLELGLGVDDPDDLARIRRSLARVAAAPAASPAGDATGFTVAEPVTGLRFDVRVAPRIVDTPREVPPVNSPGHRGRHVVPAEAVGRTAPVRPNRLSHAVLGSPDHAATERFLVEGLGFRVSDRLPGLGAFLRCSTSHHNLLVQAAPLYFLHHVAWEVADVDEVGRGASALLAGRPDRHVWGLGRHAIGSNFFWYLRDPAGTFVEYTSDVDEIPEDVTVEPRAWDPRQMLAAWGPPVPVEFIQPTDLGV